MEPAAPPLPEAMPEALPAAAPLRPPFATGWQRAGAMIFDCLFCGVPLYLLAKLLYGYPLLLINLTNLLFCLYYVVSESMFRYGSPGKMLLGIYVAKSDGSAVALGRASWRYFLWIVPVIPLLVIGYMPELLAYSAAVAEGDPERLRVLLSDSATREALRLQFFCIIGGLGASLLLQAMPVFVTKEKIGLHDWLSGTRVYRKPDRAPAYFATPSQRCGAMVLDTVAMAIVFYMLKLATDDFNTQCFLNWLVSIVYYALLEGTHLQASLGKHLLGIKVVNNNGEPTTVWRAGLRVSLYYMPVLPMTAWAVFSQVGQIFSDIAAHEGDKAYIQQLVMSIISDPNTIASFKLFGIVAMTCFILQIAVNHLPIIFTRQRTGLHDWLSGTRVYKRDMAPGA